MTSHVPEIAARQTYEAPFRTTPLWVSADHEVHDTTSTSSEQQAEEFTQPSGGPTPTPAEEAAAERSAEQVDLDQVEKKYRDMTEKGANVRGEGSLDQT